MSGLYSIPLAGLREGRHTYDFSIGDEFFETFEESEIRKGCLKADVILDKRVNLMELSVVIAGRVEVTCDRCLGVFTMPVSAINKLYVKQGEEWDEEDPELVIMPSEENQLDLSQYFFEYIHLALPIQRIHPEDKKGNSTCDPEMLDKLGEHLKEENRDSTDPRWEKLKNLK